MSTVMRLEIFERDGFRWSDPELRPSLQEGGNGN